MLVDVSVIIAAFNAREFISTAIQSALGQQHINIEVIVVNDRSLDDTNLLVCGLSRSDNRVRLLQNKYQQGPAGARNTGLEAATGEWIAVLDADDEMHPCRLAIMVERARSLHCGVLADNLLLVNHSDKKVIGPAFDQSWMNEERYLTLSTLLQRDWPGKHQSRGLGFLKPLISSKLLSSSKIRYDEDIWSGEDLLLYARLLDFGAKFLLLPECLYLYSVRPGSISSEWAATRQLTIVNKRISELDSAAVSGVNFHQRAQAFWYQQFSQCLKRGKLRPAVVSAIHLDPLFAMQAVARAAVRRMLKPRAVSDVTGCKE